MNKHKPTKDQDVDIKEKDVVQFLGSSVLPKTACVLAVGNKYIVTGVLVSEPGALNNTPPSTFIRLKEIEPKETLLGSKLTTVRQIFNLKKYKFKVIMRCVDNT